MMLKVAGSVQLRSSIEEVILFTQIRMYVARMERIEASLSLCCIIRQWSGWPRSGSYFYCAYGTNAIGHF